VKCLKRGNKRVYISNIKNHVLRNYGKIFQNNMNKIELSFVKNFIHVIYLYFCLLMRNCTQKVSNKMSVNPYLLNIELNSTALSLYQIQCRAQLDTLLYSVLCLFSLISCYLVATFELLRLKNFWKINLHQTVEVHRTKLNMFVWIRICH